MLTSYLGVEVAKDIIIRTKKLQFGAKWVKADQTNDIALLNFTGAFATAPSNAAAKSATQSVKPVSRGPLLGITSNFRPLIVEANDDVKLGAAVSTLGFPNPEIQGREPKFTRGEINSLAGIKDDVSYFQISAPVQPGNSGGPLLDGSGEVIGMVLSRLNDLTLLKADRQRSAKCKLRSEKLPAGGVVEVTSSGEGQSACCEQRGEKCL